nr:G-type lectin S-receptor-like serine/threonine-protein kinase SD2-5 [Ipomoea batatas]
MVSHFTPSSCTTLLVAALLLILCSHQSVVICGGQLAKYTISNSSSVSWNNSNSHSYTVDSPDGVQLSTVILLSQSNHTMSFAFGLICDDFGTACLLLDPQGCS